MSVPDVTPIGAPGMGEVGSTLFDAHGAPPPCAAARLAALESSAFQCEWGPTPIRAAFARSAPRFGRSRRRFSQVLAGTLRPLARILTRRSSREPRALLPYRWWRALRKHRDACLARTAWADSIVREGPSKPVSGSCTIAVEPLWMDPSSGLATKRDRREATLDSPTHQVRAYASSPTAHRVARAGPPPARHGCPPGSPRSARDRARCG